ncbi:MAG: hypothetical protein K0S93_2325 [Nitrososphaeraceae archaeon]|nr:hypothetical protein [Nitrososphaeraceae archaeon]
MNFKTTSALINHKVVHTLENIYLKIKRIYFKVKKVTDPSILYEFSNPKY